MQNKMKVLEFENSALKDANNKEIESTSLQISKAWSDNANAKIDNTHVMDKDIGS